MLSFVPIMSFIAMFSQFQINSRSQDTFNYLEICHHFTKKGLEGLRQNTVRHCQSLVVFNTLHWEKEVLPR